MVLVQRTWQLCSWTLGYPLTPVWHWVIFQWPKHAYAVVLLMWFWVPTPHPRTGRQCPLKMRRGVYVVLQSIMLIAAVKVCTKSVKCHCREVLILKLALSLVWEKKNSAFWEVILFAARKTARCIDKSERNIVGRDIDDNSFKRSWYVLMKLEQAYHLLRFSSPLLHVGFEPLLKMSKKHNHTSYHV